MKMNSATPLAVRQALVAISIEKARFLDKKITTREVVFVTDIGTLYHTVGITANQHCFSACWWHKLIGHPFLHLNHKATAYPTASSRYVDWDLEWMLTKLFTPGSRAFFLPLRLSRVHCASAFSSERYSGSPYQNIPSYFLRNSDLVEEAPSQPFHQLFAQKKNKSV